MADFLQNYWWLLLFSSILILWTWSTVRRLQQNPPEALAEAAKAQRAQDPAPTPLRADQVRSRLDALRHRQHPVLGVALAVVLFGALFVVPKTIPDVSMRAVLYIDAVVAFLILSIWRLRDLKNIREIGLTCPLCGDELTRLLLYEGRCQKCDAWLVHPNELEAAPAPLVTAGSPLRNAVGLVVLISLFVWGGYHFARLMRETRDDCAQRYAEARTPADSSRIKASKACRSLQDH